VKYIAKYRGLRQKHSQIDSNTPTLNPSSEHELAEQSDCLEK